VGEGTLERPDRKTFLEFQARNRRATWKLTAACALVVGAAGVLSAFGFIAGVGLVLFALGFVPAVACFVLSLVTMLIPGMGWLSGALSWAGGTLLKTGAAWLSWFGDYPVALWGAVLLFPVGAWLAVRAVWLAAGVGETLLEMGAREPAPGDLEERQLVNVVEEMAIAAGIPAPRVRLLDGAVANAAVAGWDASESYVIVARRVLDEFDRDATQGLLAHLVGSIGNGDLRGAAQIHSMLYVLELMIVVLLAPFARFPRRIARAWLAFPLGAGGRGEARAERARVLIALLAEHRALMQMAGDKPAERLGRDYFGPVGRVLVHACPPFLALLLGTQAATGFLLLFASLPVALLWRSRRYLADATAVQLTRNPTWLHRALARLAECGAVVPGGEPLAHLFVVGPEAATGREERRRQQEMTRWVEKLRAEGSGARAGGSWTDAAARAASLGGELMQSQAASENRAAAAHRNTFWEREGLLMGMHPPLHRRLRRLLRMGADASAGG
jgi:Zn-dependent protease with chaperone function